MARLGDGTEACIRSCEREEVRAPLVWPFEGAEVCCVR